MSQYQTEQIISTEDNRIVLRPLTLEDSALVVQWRNNERVRANYIYRERFTLESQRAYFHNMVETKRVYQFVIAESETMRPVGCTVLSSIDPAWKEAESGIFIGEDDAAGQGFALPALAATHAFGFGKLGLARLYARIFVDNTRSLRSYMKAGMKIRKILPGVECSDGTCRDMYLLDLSAGDRCDPLR